MTATRTMWFMLVLLPSVLTLTPRTGLFSAMAMSSRTFTVNSTVDASDVIPGDGVCATSAGQCTLRAAIQEANAQPSGSAITIMVPSGSYGLTLGVLTLTAQRIAILGAGSATTTVDGHSLSGVFSIASAAQATLSGLTITGGTVGQGSGGGIYSTGSLVLSKSAVTGNTAVGGDGGGIDNNEGTLIVANSTVDSNSSAAGGGIENAGTLTVINSMLSGNTAANNGGGVFNVAPSARFVLSRSTVSGNTATYGGGIYSAAILTVTNSTLSGNAAGEGAGIDNIGTALVSNSTLSSNAVGGAIINHFGIGTVVLTGTILANSTGNPNCGGPITESRGYNLDDGTSCGFSRATDLSNTNPLLGPLANNGGPTQTLALLPGSPAIDHGNTRATGCPTTDQRGMPRPDDRGDNGACDMGAYESQSVD